MHGLGDDRRPVTHGLQRGRGRIERAAVLPVLGDGHHLRALRQQLQDTGLEGITATEDEGAEVEARVEVRGGIVTLEAVVLTVALQPVEQRIIVEPVAGLGGGDPVAPALPVFRHHQRAVIRSRERLDAGDDGHAGSVCARATSARRQRALARTIWRGVLARAATSAGDATTSVRQRAREVATLSRLSE